jgi:ectoine hydroxylase-related dioxygenase (phytanoyl-CoA dioxygenase family)
MTTSLDELTPADARARFAEDGFVIFRNVIDPDLIAEASAHVDWLIAKNPDTNPEELMEVITDPFWVRLISDDRLLDVAQIFVGPDIALFASHYICKPAFSGRPVLWHQDSAFWPLDPMKVVTLWLAVDESTTENGCVQVIPGSHRDGTYAMRPREDVANLFGQEAATDVDESKAVDMVLRPGDVEVHDPEIIHGSRANNSPKRRCGLTIRYIPTSTRITEDPWNFTLHLRGELGVNKYNPRPTYEAGKHFPFTGADTWR